MFDPRHQMLIIELAYQLIRFFVFYMISMFLLGTVMVALDSFEIATARLPLVLEHAANLLMVVVFYSAIVALWGMFYPGGPSAVRAWFKRTASQRR